MNRYSNVAAVFRWRDARGNKWFVKMIRANGIAATISALMYALMACDPPFDALALRDATQPDGEGDDDA